MLIFVIRRVLMGFGLLLVASFLMYLLVDFTIDPLENLRTSTDPSAALQMEQRTEQLNLNAPPWERYFDWLGAFVTGDLGVSWNTGRSVSDLLGSAIISTIQLVSFATVAAIFLGVAVGIVSALRQYSSFDYLITFFAFLMFSLPSFWVAVLLKQWGAIGFNNFLADPVIGPLAIVGIALAAGVFWQLAVGGNLKRRLIHGGLAALAVALVLLYMQIMDWWLRPRLDWVLLTVTSLGIALTVTTLSTGLRNRRSLYTALTCVVLGLVLYFPVRYYLFSNAMLTPYMSYGVAFLLGVLAIVVGALIGVAWRGPDWKQSARTGAITAFLVAGLIFLDKVMSYWPAYMAAPAINGRPIQTIGDRAPNLGGNFWVQVLDQYTHLILPTLALMLISFAGYTRFSRGSMLEVMNQDYIRTARAKGISERTVVMRHGFRNSLIPLASIIPVDIIGLIGGALITERIFSRPGMGQLFIANLNLNDIDPVMAYLVIVAFLAIVANIVADLLYAALDPQDPGERMSTNDRNDDPFEAGETGTGSLDPAMAAASTTDKTDVVDDEPQLENAIELREVEGLSQGQIVRRRFFRHTGAMIGLVVMILIAIIAITSIGFTLGPIKIPGWWQFSHTQLNDILNPRGGPTLSMPWSEEGFAIGQHPFGQDEIGRDIFARTMKGVQTSIIVMAVIGAVATLIGTLIGAFSGFFRGKVDTVLMRFTDLIITLPVIVIGAVLGKKLGAADPIPLALALGAISWTGLARLVRGDFLSLREREFVDAARVAGATTSRIIFKHMLPNAIGVIIVSVTLLMSSAILLETALSYLGFGISPPNVSLGQMINEYQGSFNTRPWLFWWPGLFIILIALCINFIGDGLRDAFDPRQKKIPSARKMARADLRAARAAAKGTPGEAGGQA